MQVFRVDDMTCGHCAGTITEALAAADKNALVTIDLSRHLVMVEPAEAGAQQLGEAIAAAGYTPVPLAGTVAGEPGKEGSCCGCRG
jgi:copper chaperone